jgi:methylglutaconyl-CoA hydratase
MAHLDIERRDDTLIATARRGDENLFTSEMVVGLTSAVQDAGSEDSIRFVRIRSGARVFCVGRERGGSTPEELRTAAQNIVALNETLRTSPLTIVAEVNGDAAGFGAGIVAACDMAVASREARFWFPEVLAGLAPSIVISWLARTIPYKHAFDMVTTGKKIDAEQAATWGLVTEAVPAEAVGDTVDERLTALARSNTAAQREIKRFFASTRTMDAAAAASASVDALTVSALRGAAERRS